MAVKFFWSVKFLNRIYPFKADQLETLQGFETAFEIQHESRVSKEGLSQVISLAL